MSQKDLARRMTELEDDLSFEAALRSLINYEGGKSSPRFSRLQAIAEATGKPLDFFAVDGGGDVARDGRFREVA